MASAGCLAVRLGACAFVSLLFPACASTASNHARVQTSPVRVQAVALRVVGGRNAMDMLGSLTSDSTRGSAPVPYSSEQQFIADLSAVADVKVLGRPGVTVAPDGKQLLHIGAPAEPQTSELGFLSGVKTDIRLCLEPAPAPRGKLGLKISGSVLQFTPDKLGTGSAANAAYTRLRDFETDLVLATGQPALVTGPALVEHADGVWTGVIILLTPRQATPAELAAVGGTDE